jgi:hypothetical protein
MKLIATILTLFIALAANAQDSLFWSRPAYTTCFVQQSPDNYTWKTISQVQMADTNYTAPIPGATYYYRVLAGQDTSVCIYVYDSTTTVTTTTTTDTTTTVPVITTISYFKAWQTGHNIRVRVTSDRTEQAIITITDMLGYMAGGRSVTLTTGTNDFNLPAPMTGLYVVSVQTNYEIQSQQIFIK